MMVKTWRTYLNWGHKKALNIWKCKYSNDGIYQLSTFNWIKFFVGSTSKPSQLWVEFSWKVSTKRFEYFKCFASKSKTVSPFPLIFGSICSQLGVDYWKTVVIIWNMIPKCSILAISITLPQKFRRIWIYGESEWYMDATNIAGSAPVLGERERNFSGKRYFFSHKFTEKAPIWHFCCL